METLLWLAGAGILVLLLQAKGLPTDQDAKKALEKLKENPDDPEANLTLGKYLFFTVGKQDEAMPYFVKGSDAAFKKLAQDEGNVGDKGTEKVKMGDAWVAAAVKMPTAYKLGVRDRGVAWYAKSWPEMKNEPLWGVKLREQLQRLYMTNPAAPSPKMSQAPKDWTVPEPNQKAAPSSVAARVGGRSFQVVANPKSPGVYTSLRQSIVAKPGAAYDFSVWAVTDGTEEGVNDEFGILVYDDKNRVIASPPAFVLAPDQPWWKRYDANFTVPANAARFEVQLVIRSQKGNIFIDDASLKTDGKEQIKNGSFE